MVQDIVFSLRVQQSDFQQRLLALANATGKVNEGFDDVADSADSAANEISQVGRAFNSQKVLKELNQVEKKVDGLGISFKSAFSAAAGFAAAQGVFDLVTELPAAIFNATAAQEQLEIAFESIVGDAEKATKVLAQLKDFSIRTPFEPTEVNNSAKSLIAMGVATEDVLTVLNNLGNVSSAVGVPLNELAVSYGKVVSSGFAQAEELNLFTERGIPIIAQLAKQFGVSTGEVKKLGSQSKITADDIRIAFEGLGGTQGKFAGLMDKQSVALGGLLSTLKGEFTELLISIGRALTPLFYALIAAARGLVSTFGFLGDTVSLIVSGFQSFSKFLEDNETAIKGLAIAVAIGNTELILYNANLLITQIRTQAATRTIWLQTAATKALTFAQQVFNNTLKKNPIGLAIAAIAILVTFMQKLYKENDAVKSAFDRLFDVFRKALAPIIHLFSRLVTKVGEFLNNNRILESWIKILSVQFQIWGTVVGWVVEKIADLFEWLSDTSFGNGFIKTIEIISIEVAKLPAILYGALKAFEEVFVGMADSAVYFARGFTNILEGIFEGDLGLIKDGIGRFQKGIPEYFDGIKDAYNQGVNDFYKDSQSLDTEELIDDPEDVNVATVVIQPVEIKLEADTESVKKELVKIADKAAETLRDVNIADYEFQLKLGLDVDEVSAREALERADEIQAEIARYKLQSEQSLNIERNKRDKDAAFERLDNDLAAEDERIRELIKKGKATNNDLIRLKAVYESEYAELTDVYNQLEISQEAERTREIMVLENDLAKDRILVQQKVAKLLQKQIVDSQKELTDSIKSINSGLFQDDSISRNEQMQALNRNREIELKEIQKGVDEELRIVGNNKIARDNIIAAGNQRAFELDTNYYNSARKLREADARAERDEFTANSELRLQNLQTELNRGIELADKYQSDSPFGQILAGFQKSASDAAIAIEQAQQAFGRDVVLEELSQTGDDLQAQQRLIEDSIFELESAIEAGNTGLEEALEQRRKLLAETNADILENETATNEAIEAQQKRRIEAVADAAQAIAGIVFNVANAALQANIDKLNQQAATQEQNVSRVRAALEEGGEASKNFSGAQLEAEEERLRKIEELKERDLRRQEAVGKAELLISTAVAVAKAAAATSPFSFIGIASALAALAIGLSRGRAQASSAIPKFESGGYVYGQRHSKGGVLIEAEGGEYIINRTATAKFQPLLESINTSQPLPTLIPEFGERAMYAPIESEFNNLKPDIDANNFGMNAEMQRGFERMANSFESRFTSMQAAFERKQFDVYIEANTIHESYTKAAKNLSKRGKR